MQSSIVPDVPHTRYVNVRYMSQSRDMCGNDANSVIDACDALTTATNGVRGSTGLMIGVATELRKRGKRVLYDVSFIYTQYIITPPENYLMLQSNTTLMCF